MKITIISAILFVTFFINMQFAQSASFKHERCKLPKDQVLQIACTKDCGRFNRWALRKFARKLGYKIKLHNLYEQKQSYDLTKLDGILIPGGADIAPKYYIPKVEKELQEHLKSLDHFVNYTEEGERRDPFEYGLLQSYFANKKLKSTPILGICRGMQMLGVSQGIPLYIDIKEELKIKNRRYTLDKVRVLDKNSEIAKIMRRRKFRAVELHHQGPRVDYFRKHKESRWPNINLTALSNRGKIAEVLEWTDRPVLGVQFHPEFTLGKVRRRVFKWFLNQSCHNKRGMK